MSDELKIGSAKYGSDFVKRKYWKLKDGESTFRILPPMGDLAEDGKWSQFYNVHYGYKNSKGEMRVFQSSLVKNRKTKMIEVPDAALERIEKLKGELEKAKAAGNKAVVDRLMDLVGGQKAQYNLDNNHYVNAMDTQGNIGILKLRHRAKLALDATIKKLRDAGVDPLAVNTGRFFVFTRTGTGLDTAFQVEVKMTTINHPEVGEVKKEDVHVLSADILKRLKKEAAPLDKLYKRPTAEEVARIVKESDILTGRSKAIDDIIDAKNDTNANDSGDDGEDDAPEAAAQAAPAQSTLGTTPLATLAPAITSVTNTAPAPQAAAPAPVAQAAPAPAPFQTLATPPAATAALTTAQAIETMSDDDFLDSIK